MNRYAWGARIAALFTITLALALPAAGQTGGKQKAKKPASESKAGTRHLFGIDWHLSLDTALKRASSGETTSAKEKPVLVLRVLGDLNGFM